jgi:dihydroneopterin aldolase
MIKVTLQGAEFFARHGFYPEEQLTGNRFLLDIEVEFEPYADMKDDEINDTVNYEQLYVIAEQEMQQPRKLLEAVAQSVADNIRAAYPFVKNIRVELKKLTPPLKGPVAYSSVTVTNNQ